MHKKIAIIGGGLAGLAAGVELASKGFGVEVFERRPLLGGRAYSVKDNQTGDVIDNGQHLMMGCYHETLRFLKTIGTDHLLQTQERMEVDFADEKGFYSLHAPNLPAPLHLLIGLAKLQTLNLSEKWALLRFMQGVRSLKEHELKGLDFLNCEQWLTLGKQNKNSVAKFWEPLILATLNETPQIASAQMLAVVLREALLKTREDSRMIFPKVGLSELYTEAASQFIEKRKGKIHLRCGIKSFKTSSDKIEEIILEDGSSKTFDAYLFAIPPDQLLELLENWKEHVYFKRLSQFEFTPIFGINLWFDQEIFGSNFIGLLSSPIHWVFNKSKILGKPSHYLSLVMSAAYPLKQLSSDELLQLALSELHKCLPQSKKAKLLHHRLLKEMKATPSFGIGSEKLRPLAQTPLSNLYLAGDWTATGLPATIEGAVKSGYSAAECLRIKFLSSRTE